jgi:hypothetical protein
MSQDEFKGREYTPNNEGFYFVRLHQYKKEEDRHPDYIEDWLEFDGEKWDYGGYKDNCYVCLIYKEDNPL